MAYLGTKPANQVIDSTLIADGTITTSDLANQAVTPAKLSTGAPNWDTSGNVGIGTSSPAYKLEVNGGASAGFMRLASTANPTGFDIGVGGSGDPTAYIYNRNNTPLLFATNNAERMRIDSAGNLLVGRTTAYAAGQGATPTLQVDTSGNGGIVLTNGSNGILIYRDNVNSITYFYNGSNQASLNSAGSWINASDGRQKSNITDIKYGLSSVLNLQPRSYKRTDVDGDFIGFVAQELKNVIPEVVMGSEETSYGVDYGSLVAVAFKAIQEQQAIITSQADTISAMEARLTALEAK